MKNVNEMAAKIIAKVAKSATVEGRGWPPCYGILYQPTRPKTLSPKSKKQ